MTTRLLTLPRYRVILHRSTGTDLPSVVRAVRQLTRYGDAEATHRMWEAYHCGSSTVFVTHLERAELLNEQFAAFGLTTSLEPMP